MVYYVGYDDCTNVEPSPGWYYQKTHEDGSEEIIGPFSSKHDALDDMSDGAYSEYLDYQREDKIEREAYFKSNNWD